MQTFAQFVAEAAHPIPALKHWNKETPYYTHDKPVYTLTPKDQGDRASYERHHYRIFPEHDDDNKFVGYRATHHDPTKPYTIPGRKGEPIPYDQKHIGTFPNAVEAHKAVRAH